MDPERWQQIEELYEAALAVEAARRSAYLDERCGGEDDLRKEVEALLAHAEDSGRFLRVPETARPLEPGQRVSHYEIQAKLGEGGMGAVYRAHDSQLRRPVALKVLPPEYAGDPERRERLLREARAASALSHPNIVSIHEVGSDSGVDFIAMELVEGKTLNELIPAKGLPLAKALDYAAQIAGGLAKAHAAGIVHRDLKPGNVMVTDDGLVKLLDFGLARRVRVEPGHDASQSLTIVGEIAGTPAYMSPEQAEGRQTDARSDIFSFGAVLYRMLTGRQAFTGESTASVLAEVLREEPPPLGAKVPLDVEKIVRRCLRKDPARRFQHTDDLKIELEDVKEEAGSGKAGDAAGPVRKTRRWALVASAAVPLLAVGVWLVARSFRTPAQGQNVTPFTAEPGAETGPTFSPNGDQVAYAWAPEDGGNSHIYVRWVGTSNSLRLTSGLASDTAPAWSPDGRTIAFFRLGNRRAEIILVPALGGPERKLAEVELLHQMEGRWRVTWAPDGNWLLTADRESASAPYGLTLIGVPSGEKRRLTNPPPGSFGDYDGAISPDARLLAFTQSDSYTVGRLAVVDLSGGLAPAGKPRILTTIVNDRFCPAWTPDSREIVLQGGSAMWRIPADGSGAAVRLPFGENGGDPALALRGQRMAFTRRLNDVNVWRLDLGGVAGNAIPERKWIYSTADERHAAYSPDGRRIAFASNRTGRNEIWLCDADGSNPNQLTIMNERGGAFGPRWSPDGSTIAFDARTDGRAGTTGKGDIWVISSGGGAPRLLTANKAAEMSPNWSRDGKWIYFASDRSGRFEVWKQRPDGGEAVQVTRQGGFAAAESPDAKWVYYSKEIGGGALFRVPADGGEEARVSDSLAGWASFALTDKGIYFVPAAKPASPPLLNFCGFADRSVKTLFQFKPASYWGTLTASPDGRYLLYAQRDQDAADLMLVENFR